MQFTRPFKERIARGEVHRTYRYWVGPRVKVGGRYGIPPFGAVEVTRLAEVTADDLTQAAARACGLPNLEALQTTLAPMSGEGRTLYRVDLRYLGPEPLPAPQRSRVEAPVLADLRARLEAMDARAQPAPWAWATLAAIGRDPGRRAADLARGIGLDTPTFKARVRRLKALGLTESLEIGYRLSERGRQVLAAR